MVKLNGPEGLHVDRNIAIVCTPLPQRGNMSVGYLCEMESEFRLHEINKVAALFWDSIDDNKVIAFHGSMGAGKTTFIHALCEVKNVKDPVTSPTFSIINEYQYLCEGTPRVIFHLDLYRIANEEEAIRAGVEDCLYSGETCLVEWPEKAPHLFPPGTIHAYIDIINTESRRLQIRDK